MADKVLKKGFQVIIDTWENDGDASKTEVIDNLSGNVAKFVVGFARLFDRESDIGNLYEPNDSEVEEYKNAVNSYMKKYIASGKDLNEVYDEVLKYKVADANEIDEDTSIADDICWELGIMGGEFFTRRVDKIQVFEIPETITLKDVTAKFKNDEI